MSIFGARHMYTKNSNLCIYNTFSFCPTAAKVNVTKEGFKHVAIKVAYHMVIKQPGTAHE